MSTAGVQALSWYGQVVVMSVLISILAVGGLLLHYLRQLHNKNALLVAMIVVGCGCFGGMAVVHSYQFSLSDHVQTFFMGGCVAEVMVGWVFYCQTLQQKKTSATPSVPPLQMSAVSTKKDVSITVGEVMVRLYATDELVGAVLIRGYHRVSPQVIASYASLRQLLLEAIRSDVRSVSSDMRARVTVSATTLTVLERMEEVAYVTEMYGRVGHFTAVPTWYQN